MVLMIALILLYIAGLIILALLGLAALYHAVRFHSAGDKTRLVSLLYLVTTAVIFFISISLMVATDWSGSLS